MSPHHHEVLNIAQQAADWLRIMQTPELEDDEGFLNWLKESPLHVREFLLAYRMDQKLGHMDSARQIDVEALISRISPNVLPIGARAASPVLHAMPRERTWAIRIAAGVAFLTLAVLTMQFFKGPDGIYATNVGEQRTFALDDGSLVFLNTHSRVQVRFDQRWRDVYLQDGQALFEVRHDAARPFRVHAGSSIIQAIGTQFDVRRFTDRVTVSVVEGTVQVSTTNEYPAKHAAVVPAKVTAGQAATIIDAGGQIGPSVRTDTGAVVAWRQQQLVFEQAPLTQIVAEFNRYNRSPQLRVGNEEIGSRRFNGVFGARHPESLLLYLAKTNNTLVFEHRGDEVIIRVRPGPAPSEATRNP